MNHEQIIQELNRQFFGDRKRGASVPFAMFTAYLEAISRYEEKEMAVFHSISSHHKTCQREVHHQNWRSFCNEEQEKVTAARLTLDLGICLMEQFEESDYSRSVSWRKQTVHTMVSHVSKVIRPLIGRPPIEETRKRLLEPYPEYQ